MQIENLSILSDNVKHVQHDEISKTPYSLDVNTLDYCQYRRLYNSLKGEESHLLDTDFGTNSEPMKSNYLDMYEGVHAHVVYINLMKIQI